MRSLCLLVLQVAAAWGSGSAWRAPHTKLAFGSRKLQTTISDSMVYGSNNEFIPGSDRALARTVVALQNNNDAYSKMIQQKEKLQMQGPIIKAVSKAVTLGERIKARDRQLNMNGIIQSGEQLFIRANSHASVNWAKETILDRFRNEGLKVCNVHDVAHTNC